MKLHARIVEPAVINHPSILNGECIVAHHRAGQQAQQTELSVARKQKCSVMR